ncbi:amidohydrolase family protein [Domibacillus robiginosus]|uniref:amidohydrolase family protein n=1 Tax=Domibacillus robiginosus TaxID=1071054 RepID=UPI00067D286D|nr:amidohydrolase family protein [Domibacillus robiginosus]
MEMTILNARIPIWDENLYYNVTIKDGAIISVDAQEEMKSGGLLFSFSPAVQAEKNGVWDAAGAMLLPAFSDIHMHLDKSHSLPFAHNVSGTLQEAIASYGQASQFVTDENMKARMRKTVLSALAHGTRSIRTHIDFHTRLSEDVTFRGVRMALELKKEFESIVDIQVYPLLPYYPYDEQDRARIDQLFQLDIDGIGGAPHIGEEPHEGVRELFKYAVRHHLPLDIHTDESDDPNVDTIFTIAEETIKHGYEGRVNVGHLCSLAAMDQSKADRVMEKMKEASLTAVTLPAANLYLQGRGDKGTVRRGVTRIKELREAGILVATASDNVCDPFHPFGRGDLLQIAQITGYAAHMGGKRDVIDLLRMISEDASAIIRQQEKGLRVGNEASFVLIHAFSVEELFTELTQTRAVFGNGKWLSVMDTNVSYNWSAVNIPL